MRRFARSRFCAGLLALWAPLIVGLSGIVPRCALHQNGAHHAAVEGTSQAPEGQHLHGQHVSDAPVSPNAPSSESHSCSCIGGCTVSRVDAVAPEAPQFPVAVATHQPSDPARRVSAPVARDAYSANFPTGPPSSVASL